MNIGLIGVGSVGSALLRQLHRRRADIADVAGEPLIALRAAVRDPDKPRDCPAPVLGYTANAGQLAEDARIDVLVEVAGGEAWYATLASVLRSGRPVVTANKALLARHGPELFALARDRGVPLRFEAAVGGAVPVIRTLLEARRGEALHYVGGVLNGTGNFLLDRLGEGVEYQEALREAQDRGLAEPDQADDVEGLDAARKLSVLAQLAFGVAIAPETWPRIGISHLTPEWLRDIGPRARVKLLAEAWRTAGGITGYVGPTVVPADDILALPAGPENAIVLDGEPGGTTGLLGLGAGGEATASQVVADLIAVARTREAARLSVPDPAVPGELVPPKLTVFWPGPGAGAVRAVLSRLPHGTAATPSQGTVGPVDAGLLLHVLPGVASPPLFIRPERRA